MIFYYILISSKFRHLSSIQKVIEWGIIKNLKKMIRKKYIKPAYHLKKVPTFNDAYKAFYNIT